MIHDLKKIKAINIICFCAALLIIFICTRVSRRPYSGIVELIGGVIIVIMFVATRVLNFRLFKSVEDELYYLNTKVIELERKISKK